MRSLREPILRVVVLAGILVGTTGCGEDDVEAARKRMQEERRAAAGGHGSGAPDGAPNVGSSGPTDGAEIPLKTTGLGSAAELKRELAKLQDPSAADHFERAFRLTFTSDASKRDYHEAERLLRPLLETHPKFAPAYRTLGYAEFNLNPMEPTTSIGEYEKAVELDPSYGEAHYAIAFMCAATGERQKGVDHYRKAIALGIADERNIGQRFYSDLLQQQ